MTDPRQAATQGATALLDAEFFRALCEPVRIDLLRRLIASGRADIAAISRDLPQDRSVISRHLQVLRRAGIVTAERDGRHVYYQLDGPAVVAKLEAVTDTLRRLVPDCCPGR